MGVGLENFEDQLNQEDAGDDDDELPEMRGRSASKMAIAVVEKAKVQDDELPESRGRSASAMATKVAQSESCVPLLHTVLYQIVVFFTGTLAGVV